MAEIWPSHVTHLTRPFMCPADFLKSSSTPVSTRMLVEHDLGQVAAFSAKHGQGTITNTVHSTPLVSMNSSHTIQMSMSYCPRRPR